MTNENILFPNKLVVGDSIGIIASARKIENKELEESIKLFESWGLNVVFSPNLFEADNQFSGNDTQRAADLQWAIDHSELKAVIVARGGYGTSRIIDDVDFSSLDDYPKWFIGFSDVTVLLSQLFKENKASIHGPVALLLGKNTQTENANRLKQLLFEGNTPEIHAKAHVLNTQGAVEGVLIGGNLTIIHTLLSTSSDIDFEGKILFIEDLDEYLYHIDRMMVHLGRTGKLKKLAGLVVGHLSDMRDNTIPFGHSAEEIVKHACSKYNFPIAFGMPIGHEDSNYPVVVGANYKLTVSSKGSSLELNEIV